MSKEKYRSRLHMIQLYTDNKNHMDALEIVKKQYDYIGILHNKDYFTKEDEQKNLERVAGTLKKEHYHIILRFKSATWSTAICKELNLEQHLIENVRNFDNAMQYLIHYNDKDKAQYTIDEVFGNLKPRLIESINKNTKNEVEKVTEIMSFIKTFERPISITEFAIWCAQEGYWSEFRRSSSIFFKIIEEHNYKYYEKTPKN